MNGEGSRGRLKISFLPVHLNNNRRRVVTLPFEVNTYVQVADIFERVARLSDDEVSQALAEVLRDFGDRHNQLTHRLEEHYAIAARLVDLKEELSRERKLLLGAYFTMEYSLESTALFNPSIVPHPDQSGAGPGEVRFVMSLRALGEGHLSSTVFQTGTIAADGSFRLDPPSGFSARTRVNPDRIYYKELFGRKLKEIGLDAGVTKRVLSRVPDEFTLAHLLHAVDVARASDAMLPQYETVFSTMIWVARANYQLQLAPGESISDLILFPHSQSEARGIEDLRLVRYVDTDGSARYYGTYTAFDGQNILPMLLETEDFRTISIHTLNGACVQNKGMALFPRRIDGHYVMCSRIDGRNLYLMYSDYVHFWETARLLAAPKYPWELRLIGNCGSPLETPAGWLLLTHGVGPMRRYCIGAMLLDLKDPFRIIGRLREPLLAPSVEEREGHVPNVVYSCGGMIHGGKLIIPYAFSDTATRIALVEVDELLERLVKDGAG